MTTPRTPTLAEVLTATMERTAADIRVALPGVVESFDPETQLASVKPQLRESFEKEDGSEGTESLAVVSDVPVIFAGGGGFASTLPVKPGDTCLLVFADRSIDRWIDKGGDVDPVDLRRHDLSDAIAFVGLSSQKNKLEEFDANRAVFGNKGPRVACDGSIVHVGVDHEADAGQAILRGDVYREKEDTLLDEIATICSTAGGLLSSLSTLFKTAAGANSVPMSGGAAASPSFIAIGEILGQAGSQFSQVQGKVSMFKASASDYKSTKAKVP